MPGLLQSPRSGILRTGKLLRRNLEGRFSSGAARLVNKLCTHALIYGAQNKHRIVDDQMVKRVIQGELS
ncbi:hypothetical protein NKT34_23365 [Paenibacillus polysaccharolyticus]|uniref:hypothetical protein n=1 Tax=Paenibacillus polysaccharolyticus TaxID=582692 RepID=UPI0020A09CC0|nr:hypothetical protein [Paenibacillus polysaccharolyticus]MCP1136241.1 hypothetical protein [Paenibacillus polysaccharolyticus]